MAKTFVFFLLYVFITGTDLSAQFASHITHPYKSQVPTEDFNDWSYKLSTTINIKDLKDHVYTLASDRFEGRETGSPGITKAANYLAEQFEDFGFAPATGNDGYFQQVDVTFSSWNKMKLSIEGDQLKFLKDFIAFPQWSQDLDLISKDMLFLGYGIDDPAYSDYENVDVAGKVVIVFDGEPMDTSGHSFITGDDRKSKWSRDWLLKSETAKRYGASLLIICSNDLLGLINENRRFLVNGVAQMGDFMNSGDQHVNTIFLSSSIAEKALGGFKGGIIAKRDRQKEDRSVRIQFEMAQQVKTKMVVKRTIVSGQNVLGFIEGSDRKEEVIIVSAHYDHIGQRNGEIYYGADDNASGTATVLEIAEALATAKKLGKPPRKSILCLLMTGEEKGLLGSAYYVNHPVFPLSKTVADVNIDMVGRRDKVYQTSSEPYVYVIGSDRISQDLHELNESVNQKYSQLTLDYKYNDEADPNRFYYRSDHYNFAKEGVPSIFFFNGVHSDYHRLTDTPDKIDFPLLKIRAQHIFHVVWELANREERLQMNSSEQTTP